MRFFMRFTRFILLLALTAPLALAAAQQPPDRLRVVATTTQAYDLLRVIGGDVIDLTGLMGAGVDPHLYQPTESDITAMSVADLVMYSGLHLEGQFGEVFKGLGERRVRTYALATPTELAGYELQTHDLHMQPTGTVDPHFWFEPRNWQLAAAGAADVLAAFDPANAALYHANADAYIAQLDLLYAWALDAMSTVPPQQRVLITSHDAFQYFGTAFGWQVRGLQGISTRDEAGVADVQQIVSFVVDNNIPVMYVESSVPPDAIQSVQEGVRARGFEVGLGQRELYSDAMGDTDTFGGTYIGMTASNVIIILSSMGYPIPAWPDGLTPLPADLLALGSNSLQ